MATHAFQAAVNEFGEHTRYCARCGAHWNSHGALAGVSPVPSPEPEGVLTMAELAAAAGVTEGSIRVYRSRGVLPAPDGRLGNVPFWRAETAAVWLAARRGKGNPGWHKGMPTPGPRKKKDA